MTKENFIKKYPFKVTDEKGCYCYIVHRFRNKKDSYYKTLKYAQYIALHQCYFDCCIYGLNEQDKVKYYKEYKKNYV